MQCKICKAEFASLTIKICKKCIEKKKGLEILKKNFEIRKNIGLPVFPPKDKDGIVCNICGNFCRIGKGKVGYCGLTQNKNGKLERKIGNEKIGLVSFYKDWHVTNCVASWICAGGTGKGYPKYAAKNSAEIGYANASIFVGTCSYFCLYCQNTSWHEMSFKKKDLVKAEKLVEWIISDQTFTCVCWFGGSPETQSPFVLEVSKRLVKLAEKEGRILRVCLETNGNFAWKWLKKIAKLSLKSGGGIKFDLKTPKGSPLNLALSGISNLIAYKNFEKLVNFHQKRPEVPFLRASTLLIPYYIGKEEVEKIAEFISKLDDSIPYSLLAFYPCFKLTDVGFTSKNLAFECYKIAKQKLKFVNLGNLHLLA